ncbi:PA0069 family radical SAM protein [Mucilaginibacter sp. AW1-7]|jgi:DNA repair photolyase|uniref:PA0069 family radical SAM protein n=1 Tax=unclassified Mucilaginibacter TaxID=2617802 RepID=UPI0008BC3E4A|nr:MULTISPECIES: PA0069 family radical SAM protein [unclassified Mucilaginibacter]WDF78380.1 PA0069 family radical SAM protein [Mucilaginibacter sp. KACC 22773]SEP36554.1 DNA repair photolyase [Mucilaginibacter sp. OK283]
MAHEDNPIFFKGRGAQVNTHNKFLKSKYVAEHVEGLDEPLLENSATQLFEETPKKIVSESNSPDLSHMYSINPYQGCEHGCIYCYARNTHEYYGFSAGLDFERKIIVKRNAPELLEQYFNKKNYKPVCILLSGNTDCYQPIERDLKITRRLLEVFLKYKNPVAIITKNNLVLRDLDILTELAAMNLVHVNVSITSLDEQLRQKLEPRTVTATGRLAVVQKLSEKGIPVRVMAAPIIPGLNSNEVPNIIKAAADRGALAAGFTIVRLNGSIADLFSDWIYKAFPNRAEKVLNMIRSCHDGNLNDSDFGRRMSGEGKVAESIHQMFRMACNRFLDGREMPEYDYTLFVPRKGKQTSMF